MDFPKIGVYGIGTMGAALALNMADKGVPVHVSNRSTDEIMPFLERAGPLANTITAHSSVEDLIDALTPPRVILFMIPSTKPMDDMIDQIIDLLVEGDTIIDAGNADFHDTRRRAARLAEKNLNFVGLGVSGGENGARHGPSMMFGGSTDSWQLLQPVAEAIAAKKDGDPCVDRLGPDGAGHFVKTVHNGIEYADMQIIAEAYGLMRHGAGMDLSAIAETFGSWNEGQLKSYLLEISAALLPMHDAETGKPAVDVILDSAGQKGTGRWTAIEALRLGQSATAIEAAVAARGWSAEKDTRAQVAEALGDPRGTLDLDVSALAEAFGAARLLAHAQGFRILAAASEEFDWSLDMARIAEIWRAGCIIRSALLDDIAEAFHKGAPCGELILAPKMIDRLKDGLPHLRAIVTKATEAGHAVPALASALAFADGLRQPRGTADLIQAQRDYFGRHGFQRVDKDGKDFHGPWWD